MINDRFAQLLARKFSGEASAEELRELHDYLKDHPQDAYFFEMIADYWSLEPARADDAIQEEIHFHQIISIAEKEPPAEEPVPEVLPRIGRPAPWKQLAAAAVFLGVILLAYFWERSSRQLAQKNEMGVNEVVAETGARPNIFLPDGTQVWLNSESKLEYKVNFNDSIREVTLEGEAFFDVVKDRKRPFIVHTSDINIRVLGTAFNVKSYPHESQIEATLIHGMIEVTNRKEPTSPKVILRPHEKLVFQKVAVAPATAQEKQSVKEPFHKPFSITQLPMNKADSSLVETSWVYNKLVFDNESFEEIARKMERWYKVKITFRSDKVARILLHGEFKNESIEEALRALQYIEPFQYRKEGNQIEIL